MEPARDTRHIDIHAVQLDRVIAAGDSDVAAVTVSTATDASTIIPAPRRDLAADVTLSGANIDVSSAGKAAVSTTGEGNVNIELNGSNALKSGHSHAGLEKNNDGNLTIAIENKMEHKDENKHEHYLRREFSYSNYQQCYTLPEDADREKISAKVADGILEVEIPKLTPKEEAKTTKNIEVK